MHARIADFGLAVFADGASRTFGSVRGGNIRWLAPEIMDPNHFKNTSTRPTCAADIYSFACLLVEVSVLSVGHFLRRFDILSD